jgi:hypothetical protein
MRFPAPWDRTLRITTVASVVVLLAILGPVTYILVRVARDSEVPGMELVASLVAAAAAATIGLAWALAPKGYAILGSRLVILRPLRPVEIPLASIRAARADDEALRGALRIGGSGGLFGYYGRFWSRRLGAFRASATRRTGLVVVDTDRDRFVLSPEPVGRFLEALLAHAPSAIRTSAGAPALAPRPMPRASKTWIALLVLAVPLSLGAALLGVVAFTPVAARVEGGEVRIERRLVGPAVIPLAEVRAVRPLPAAQARRLRRVAGAALPSGVRYGEFRSRELGDVRLYAWRDEGYVLLETADERVVVTPVEPEAFVAAVSAGARPGR